MNLIDKPTVEFSTLQVDEKRDMPACSYDGRRSDRIRIKFSFWRIQKFKATEGRLVSVAMERMGPGEPDSLSEIAGDHSGKEFEAKCSSVLRTMS